MTTDLRGARRTLQKSLVSTQSDSGLVYDSIEWEQDDSGDYHGYRCVDSDRVRVATISEWSGYPNSEWALYLVREDRSVFKGSVPTLNGAKHIAGLF